MPRENAAAQSTDWQKLIRFAMMAILGLGLAGCSSAQSTSPTAKVFKSKGGHDHDHEHSRADAMLEDMTLPDGTKCHAGLSAHLDPKGNELDVFFESLDKEPKPVAVPASAQITARVTREGDDKPYHLSFQPAPAQERPNDPAGRCSRFSASAPWMKEDDKLTVVITVEYEGQLKRVTFADFVPRQHAHQHESEPPKGSKPSQDAKEPSPGEKK